MRPLLLSEIARWCEARLIGPDAEVTAVSTDTRALGAGSLFVAIRGERVDGHDFVAQAVARGAAGALVQRRIECDLPQLLVGDTELALGEFAAGVQAGRSATVIGLTGSNGKTTVKTLVHGILARVGRSYANPGNRNNEIGLPMAVIDAPEDAQFAVYEMGAGKPGDIAYLTSIVRPQVALVNNVAPAHLERLGTLLGVAETKGALYEALPADGVAVINADDAFAPYFEQRVFAERAAGRRILRFGLDNDGDITARDLQLGTEDARFRLVTPEGAVDVALPLTGRHNVLNALAAAGLALGAGAPLAAIREGLQHAQAVPGRQIAHTLTSGAVLIDDSYNANPGSVAAAIETLVAGLRATRAPSSGPSGLLPQGGEGAKERPAVAASSVEAWLVLGDMKELGAGAEPLHAEVGDRARARGLKRLYSVGPLARAASRAFGDGGRHFEDQGALIAALSADLRAGAQGVRCLVKGSRSSAMEKVVAALLAADEKPTGEGTGHAA